MYKIVLAPPAVKDIKRLPKSVIARIDRAILRLQSNPLYQKEQGFTPEDWLSYALTVLEERNEVIDDWQSKGSISYLTGAYFYASGDVPLAGWFRAGRQAYLGRLGPGHRHEAYGARAAVRVEKD